MVQKRERISRIICALLLPFFTCAFQWRLWFIFKPFVWFLFYPTVFFSSRIGGKFSGITSTILSAALVMYIFIPPQLSLSDKSPNNLYSVAVFVLMGLMFSYTHDRLERATRRATEAEHQVRINGLQAERVKVSEDLIRSEERLRLALEATSDALWDWDMRSGIVFRSPRFYELVNRPPYDDASRDFDFFITTVHPDDRAGVLSAIRSHISGATPAIEFDYRLADRGEETRWLRIRGSAIERDHDNSPLRMTGTITDITERKRTEEEIRRLNVTLEQRVEQRTAELVAANHELDAFAYAVSHDLRAPLRAMNGFSQALEEDYGAQLQGEARVYLDQIVNAGKRMGELIDGLLNLSRNTRGELRYDRVDLSVTGEQIRAELTALNPGRMVAWEIEPGLLAYGDSRMLQIVMQNLLGNAWKYTSATPEASIRLYSSIGDDGGLWYCISDNGAGFDMAHAANLFKPFQRLHRQDEFPGIGIGLATVQRIVNRHGGTIRATGEPGKGATFLFTLPSVTAETLS